MGLVYTTIGLSNPREAGSTPLPANALVDTGSMYLCIPEHIATQLRFEQLHEREVTIADGSKKVCPYVGPVMVHFNGRACFTGALVLGEQVLMGAIPLEDMDLVINPSTLKVTVNPESPDIPHSIVM